jgi:hypothetical protein
MDDPLPWQSLDWVFLVSPQLFPARLMVEWGNNPVSRYFYSEQSRRRVSALPSLLLYGDSF